MPDVKTIQKQGKITAIANATPQMSSFTKGGPPFTKKISTTITASHRRLHGGDEATYGHWLTMTRLEKTIGGFGMQNPRGSLQKFIFLNSNQPNLTAGASFKVKEVDTGSKYFRSASFWQSKLGVTCKDLSKAMSYKEEEYDVTIQSFLIPSQGYNITETNDKSKQLAKFCQS